MRDELVAAGNVETAREGLKVAIDRGSVLGGIFFGAVPETVPETRLHKVGLPTSARAKRAFLRDWARRNSRRAAAGLAPILLILPLAGAASAQEGLVDLVGLDGVVGFSVLENGEILVRLENGKSLRLDASLVRVEADGTILVTAYAAEVIAGQGAEEPVAGTDAGGATWLGAGVAGLALAGAAGGGGGGGTPVSTPVELAYAIDGYLAGAQIFGDANGNGFFDEGEIQSTTAADGSFNAALFPDDVTLVAVGGIDISTGEPFTGTLKAPAGSTVITPLTTLIQTVIENDDGPEPLSPADAAAQIGSALGLTGDLLNDDPVAIAEQGGSLAQLEASAKIAALINLVTAAAPGDPEGAVDAVLANIAASLAGGAGSEVLSDATQIGNAVAAAGDLIEVDSTALASAIATATTEIGTAVAGGGLAELEAVQSVIQGGLTEAVEQSVGQTGTTALDTANAADIYAEAVALRPVITAFTPTDDPINGAGGIEVSGTGRPGTLVTAELGLASASTTVDADGNWGITFASLGIKAAGTPDENIALVVTAETASGITSAPATGAPVYLVDTLRPSGFQFIEITGQDALYINAEQMANAAITGTGEPGSILTYTINGGPDQVIVVPGDGFISIDISNDFVQELNTVFFTVRDPAGNVGQGGTGSLSYYVDTIAPEAPTSSYDNAVLSQPTPGAAFSGSGTGEPGAAVDTYLLQEGQDPIWLGRTTVQPDGSWSFTSLLNGIPEGEYQVQAVSPDLAGNQSAAPAEQLIIDYSAPATPAITSAGQIGSADIVDGDYVISGTAEPNTAIVVSVDGVDLPETTSDGSGNWSVTVTASDGTFDIAAVARDEFSRLSGEATATIEVDTTAPTIDTVVVDGLVSAAEAGALAVTGTVSDAGAEVSIALYRIDGGGRFLVENTTVTADGSGAWQVGFDLSGAADGDYEVDISVSDGVNAPTAQQAAASFILDKIAPELAVTDPATNLVIGSTDLADGAYTISGTAEAGSSVAVTINGSTTALEATDGTWFVERTAIEGDDVISVVATDAAGNSSTPVERTVTYDATPPVNVAIDSFDSVVNSLAAEVVFSGTAEEGATVEVEIQPTAGSPIALTLDSFTGGEWTASGPVPAEDTYTVAVTVTDAAGNTTEVVSVASFVVDTTPPAAPTGVILSGDDGNGVINLAEEGAAALQGTASAGAEVTYETSLGASGTVSADLTTGAFTIPLAGLLGDGDTNVAVREIDGAGNPSAPVDVLVSADLTAPATPAIDAVTGDNVIDATEAAGGTTTYTGTGETGSVVELFISGASAGTAEVTGGVWEITADVPADGDYEATIQAADAAGNVTAGLPVNFSVSTTDPAVSIDPLAVGAVANADEVGAAITVSGVFSNTTSVSVRVLDGAVEVLAQQAAALDVGAGTWTIDLDLSGLGDGDFTIEAVAESGGVTASSTVALSIDATSPAAPVFDLVSVDDVVGLPDLEAGSYTLTGTVEEGGTVSLTFNGTETVSAVVEGTTWSYVRTAAEGTDSVVATATDAAGNTSGTSSTSVLIDLTPPDAPVVDPYGTSVNGAAEGVDISGSGTDGDLITVTLTGAETVVEQTTVSGSTWSVFFAVPADGDYAVTVIAADPAGNETASGPLPAISVDTVAPDAPVIDVVEEDGVVNADEASGGTYTVTGSAEANGTVRFDDGAGGVFDAPVGGDGFFTIELTASEGTDTWSVTAIDAAGNSSGATPLDVTIDTTAPAAPAFDLASATVDSDGVSTVVISGTGDAGSAVTLSSTLFAAPIEVTVAGDGTWTTEPLDLSSRPDGEYTITAVASDAAGNTSGATNATRTLDAAPPVVITLNSGEVEGDFVLFSANEFAIYPEPGESEVGEGFVSGVPAETTVTLDLAGINGAGQAFALSYNTTTDEAGSFSITIPEADIIANDGMREPGTVTFAVGGSTLNLEFLVNSAINDGTGAAFLVGRYAAEPVADAEDTLGLTGMALEQAGILSDGTLVAIMNSNTDPGYQVIATYDDTGAAPVEFFAFDGGGFTDLAALSSQVYLRGDEVLIVQASLSGTLDPLDVTQQDDPLLTVYRVPAASLGDALPALGESPNFNSAAGGVTSFAIGLQDIDSSYAGGGIPTNIAYLFTDISNATGDPLVLVTREDVSAEPGVLSEAYLVSVDLNTETVTSYPVEASSLWFDAGSQELAPEKIFEAIQTDEDGNYVLASFEAPGSGDGILRGVIYDYGAEQFSATALGDSGSRQVMVTVGGREILDGGDGDLGVDDDVIVVGNTTGTEGNLQVTISGGFVTLSVDTAALLANFDGEPDDGVDPFLISFDLFALGSATMTDIAGSLGATYTQVTQTDFGTTADGFSFARVTFDLDLAGLRAAVTAETAPDAVDLFSTAASGVDGSAFYGFGANVASDPTVAGAAPQFDGLIKVGGVDGSGTQIVVVEDSAGRGGQDMISGLDISSGVDEDVIRIEADFFNVYQGTGFETIPDGEGPFALAEDTGIVVFQGTNSIEDEAVVAMVNDAGLGLVSESVIVVVADASGTGLFSIGFDDAGLASLETTDSFARLDGVTDLSAFGADNIELLPTV